MSNTECVKFSEREQELLQHASDGLTDRQIAELLDISRSGTRYYWERIQMKLGAINRTHAVALAIRKSVI